MFHVCVFFLEPVVWFSSKIYVILSLLSLARRWPKLMSYWEQIEMDLPVYTSHKQNLLNQKKVKIFIVIVTVIIVGKTFFKSILYMT